MSNVTALLEKYAKPSAEVLYSVRVLSSSTRSPSGDYILSPGAVPLVLCFSVPGPRLIKKNLPSRGLTKVENHFSCGR
jgi:hypothetical protein